VRSFQFSGISSQWMTENRELMSENFVKD
jgi:hypothetical protein